jgi:5-methylcytosine-specific restriction endonuclease McrA
MTARTPCRCGCDTDNREIKLSHALKGRTFTAESLQKMSDSRRGRKETPEWTERKVAALRGRKHPKDCNHCASIQGDGNGRWNDGASQKSVRRRLRPGARFDSSITRRGLLSRDGWRCQICGDAIPDVTWPTESYLDYGTVDHILPLSEGGAHTWENVQAAHFRCNSQRWYASRRSA